MIKITRQTDYGIVLMTCFDGPEKGSVMSARDIAANSELPLPTVSKILKALTRADLLVSTRGVNGGYALARPSSEITIADLIEALEGPISLTDCAEGERKLCLIPDACPCRDNWDRINVAIRSALQAVRLSDMASGCQAHLPDPGLMAEAETEPQDTGSTDSDSTGTPNA
ncbi:MAG: SUF system Fe-S cluster assembly regulator [Planctomycetota bacterium]|jgi:FeS assembly SUF system regulator